MLLKNFIQRLNYFIYEYVKHKTNLKITENEN